jgi:hypothetical protein
MNESVLSLLLDVNQATKKGMGTILKRQRARLADIVAFARAHSPYYRALYKDLPSETNDHTMFPVTDKKTLMARFDDWATDREVMLEKARAFATNPDLIGERFLGKYTLATTSGTTGTPGIFIIDDGAMRVTSALFFRMVRSWLGLRDVTRIVAEGCRMAMVADIGHRSATTVAAARLLKSPSRRKRIQLLSVRTPLPQLVAQLNDFQPAHLSTTADRYLTIDPRALVSPISPPGKTMSGPAAPVDVGSALDDRGSALGEELHALIDCFSSSKDERRHTHHGCAPFLRAFTRHVSAMSTSRFVTN